MIGACILWRMTKDELFLYACRHGCVALAKYYLTFIGSYNVNCISIANAFSSGKKISLDILDMLYYYGIRSEDFIDSVAESAIIDWELNKDAFYWCEKRILLNYRYLLDYFVCNT